VQKVLPVILSGGAGARLWPASRSAYPKQFVAFLEGETTFHSTLQRIRDASLFLPPIVVAGQNFISLVEQEFESLNMPGHILVEPVRRDTAPAIAAATALAMETVPTGLIFVMAADHVVRDAEAFASAVRAGIPAAQEGWIVTFGIKPDATVTGYGYIEPAAAIREGASRVGRFVEKPSAAVAQQLIAQGCLWNSGNFLFRADVMMEELRSFAPDIAAASKAAVASRKQQPASSLKVDSLAEDSFKLSPSRSIDYALMEHSKKLAVIAADYGWSDLGSWNAIWAASSRDEHGNARNGSTSAIDTRSSLISSFGPHVAVIGLSDIAVVATPDAVLVAPRDVADALKPLVAELQHGHVSAALAGARTSTNHIWGKTTRLHASDELMIELNEVHPGKSVYVPPAQQDSVLTIVQGHVDITANAETFRIGPKEQFILHKSQAAELANNGTQKLVMTKTILTV
jgi:mannose-1-phosphate guanylyltransferase / mannose-6-phosphate isomerase